MATAPSVQRDSILQIHQVFQSLVSCPADVPLELFEAAVSQLIHHLEYNSTLTLRSETISDSDTTIPTSALCLEGYHPSSTVRLTPLKLVNLRAFRPRWSLHHLYLKESLPYYHPTVSHLAFRFIPSSITTTSDSASAQSALRIQVVSLPSTPINPNSRLYRTALTLLDTRHRYLWGAFTHNPDSYRATHFNVQYDPLWHW
ncbi:hypothetical protein BDR06DRAFT_1007204 [Suillus hirtellus]|nr:hypothetical protein BDR06DRAFT_1007204 [Suillus hirtellus]